VTNCKAVCKLEDSNFTNRLTRLFNSSRSLIRAEVPDFLSPLCKQLEGFALVEVVSLPYHGLVADAQFRRELEVDLVNVRHEETSASSTPPDAERYTRRVGLSVKRDNF
jgi:hypothetical protein